MNETKTERMTRELLEAAGYSDGDITVEEQISDNPKIAKLLKLASKRGDGRGRPEFIITSSRYPELLIVIECKADPKKHRSADLDKYADFACDGALLYASYLAKEYDVIAIGVSGETQKAKKISTFMHLKGEDKSHPFAANAILSLDDFYRLYIQAPEKFNVDYAKLLDYTQKLNGTLHLLKIKESQRSLLISSILIALKNSAFAAVYKKHKTAKHLTESLVQTVIHELDDSDTPKDKIENLKHAYSFIKTHSVLSVNKTKLETLISEINLEVNGFMATHRYFDTIGQFYIEFLRYANNDKGLGIVLTPPHITELFVELAQVNKDSTVIDNCCGTGGFLISAMKKMIRDSNGDSKKIKSLKQRQIHGIEYQDDIYALAISNMILQDDGKSSIRLANCFDEVEAVRVKKPTIGLLNPPYKSESSDIEELEFVKNNLQMLEPNGTCIALIPLSCVLSNEGGNLRLKEEIMAEHTVEAVMSLPEDLFHNSKVGVITCALVLTAKTPHPKNKKTWLGYWRDDGFVKIKGKGRVDKDHRWRAIQDSWIDMYVNREEIDGLSVVRKLKPTDEWCAEAYLKTDYSVITEESLLDEIKSYLAFDLKG
jgi:type I restriction enzyme M protein